MIGYDKNGLELNSGDLVKVKLTKMRNADGIISEWNEYVTLKLRTNFMHGHEIMFYTYHPKYKTVRSKNIEKIPTLCSQPNIKFNFN